ncbi:MAG: ATP-binding protein [Puia sp.]
MNAARLEDMIRHEPENTYLDFKMIEYNKEQNPSFLKDVLTMANANIEGEWFIIIGVKLFPDGEREIAGVPSLTDAATYQQLVADNIENELSISYESFCIDDKQIGVFTISQCGDRPFMMKKDSGSLRKGDIWIRKGTSQRRADGKDLDRMIAGKLAGTYFEGEISARFSDSKKDFISLPFAKKLLYPSEEKHAEILKAIELKKRESREPSVHELSLSKIAGQLALGEFNYKPIEVLEKDATTVKKDYEKNDLYYLYETRACKFNLELLNEGDQYLEDVSVEISIPRMDGLNLAEQVHTNPSGSLAMIASGPDIRTLKYPKILLGDDQYKIMVCIGDLRHHIPSTVFPVPLRIVFTSALAGFTIPVRSRIFAKNVQTWIDKELKIVVEG